MSHQLVFYVTLWSDDKDALLELESYLKNLENAAGVIRHKAKMKLIANYLESYSDSFNNAETHSHDINWDDEPEDVDEWSVNNKPDLKFQRIVNAPVENPEDGTYWELNYDAEEELGYDP